MNAIKFGKTSNIDVEELTKYFTKVELRILAKLREGNFPAITR